MEVDGHALVFASEHDVVLEGVPGLGFMAVVDFATSDFETCPKYQNWANFINKFTTESYRVIHS